MEGITNELIINALSQDTESINNEFMAQVASSGMESMIIKALLPVIAIMAVIVAINYILSAIGYVKIFQKANIDNPIAKGMIPLWNTFTAFQMTDNLNINWSFCSKFSNINYSGNIVINYCWFYICIIHCNTSRT